jgi:bifunctional UDP-N-acetylglucosamine pyrophosphorylase/glucosamine-1-phosphate N-acetyltransferase
MVREHFERGVAATVLTMDLDDPTGYGRIVRDADGTLARIVEHRDATPEELALHEVNSGMYVLPVPETLEILKGIKSDNDQNEVYLTDVIAGLRARGERVAACKVADATLVLGVNSQEELAEAERLMTLRNQ